MNLTASVSLYLCRLTYDVERKGRGGCFLPSRRTARAKERGMSLLVLKENSFFLIVFFEGQWKCIEYTRFAVIKLGCCFSPEMLIGNFFSSEKKMGFGVFFVFQYINIVTKGVIWWVRKEWFKEYGKRDKKKAWRLQLRCRCFYLQCRKALSMWTRAYYAFFFIFKVGMLSLMPKGDIPRGANISSPCPGQITQSSK